jgi:hypothetical protein
VRPRGTSWWAPCAALACGSGCLPSDDRPPPGNVTFTVSPSAAVRDGVTTDDGWRLSFSRLMLGIGRTGLSDSCTEYAEPRYDRLLDVTKGSGQKLSIIYGLGRCDVRFRIAPPSLDAVLGTGVTPSDKLFMGTYGTDPYARNTVSVRVEGRAERDGVVEQFRWSFRQNTRYTECRAAGDAGDQLPITLVGDESIIRDISIHGEALFRDEPEPEAHIRFSPFAAADLSFGNADGVVDFDELALVPLPVAGGIADSDGGILDASVTARDARPDSADASAPYQFSEGGTFVSADGSSETVETLRDFVYVLLLPMLPRLQGTARCTP